MNTTGTTVPAAVIDIAGPNLGVPAWQTRQTVRAIVAEAAAAGHAPDRLLFRGLYNADYRSFPDDSVARVAMDEANRQGCRIDTRRHDYASEPPTLLVALGPHNDPVLLRAAERAQAANVTIHTHEPLPRVHLAREADFPDFGTAADRTRFYGGRAGHGRAGYYGNTYTLEREAARGSTLELHAAWLIYTALTNPQYLQQLADAHVCDGACFCHGPNTNKGCHLDNLFRALNPAYDPDSPVDQVLARLQTRPEFATNPALACLLDLQSQDPHKGPREFRDTAQEAQHPGQRYTGPAALAAALKRAQAAPPEPTAPFLRLTERPAPILAPHLHSPLAPGTPQLQPPALQPNPPSPTQAFLAINSSRQTPPAIQHSALTVALYIDHDYQPNLRSLEKFLQAHPGWNLYPTGPGAQNLTIDPDRLAGAPPDPANLAGYIIYWNGTPGPFHSQIDQLLAANSGSNRLPCALYGPHNTPLDALPALPPPQPPTGAPHHQPETQRALAILAVQQAYQPATHRNPEVRKQLRAGLRAILDQHLPLPTTASDLHRLLTAHTANLPPVPSVDAIRQGLAQAQTIAARNHDLGIQMVPYGSDLMPRPYQRLADPPILLHALTNNPQGLAALQAPWATVVGSRQTAPSAVDATRKVAAHLSKQGFVIASGLALGADAGAHQGAIDAHGLTVALLGHGINDTRNRGDDYLYPAKNKPLMAEMLNAGAIILSEYPSIGNEPYDKTDSTRFVERDRLQVGELLVVAQAGRTSGTKHAVNLALELGIPIGCIWLSNFDPNDQHTTLSHDLIASKRAAAITSTRDLAPLIANALADNLRPPSEPAPSPDAPTWTNDIKTALFLQEGGISNATIRTVLTANPDLPFNLAAIETALAALTPPRQLPEPDILATALDRTNQALAIAAADGTQIITCRHPDMLHRFATMDDPPSHIFAQARDPQTIEALLRAPWAAVVGARDTVPAALDAAAKTATTLADHDFVIVSGLARGADAKGHEAALAAGKPTIAILGHGINRYYTHPPEHQHLLEAIIANGGLALSTHPSMPDERTSRTKLYARDLLIACADVVVAAQAAPGKGTAHTLDAALAKGVPVACIDIPVHHHNPDAAYGLQLIADGRALPIRSTHDIPTIVDQLRHTPPTTAPSALPTVLTQPDAPLPPPPTARPEASTSAAMPGLVIQVVLDANYPRPEEAAIMIRDLLAERTTAMLDITGPGRALLETAIPSDRIVPTGHDVAPARRIAFTNATPTDLDALRTRWPDHADNLTTVVIGPQLEPLHLQPARSRQIAVIIDPDYPDAAKALNEHLQRIAIDDRRNNTKTTILAAPGTENAIHKAMPAGLTLQSLPAASPIGLVQLCRDKAPEAYLLLSTREAPLTAPIARYAANRTSAAVTEVPAPARSRGFSHA